MVTILKINLESKLHGTKIPEYSELVMHLPFD
jgi:hypothetical protein